MHEPWHKKIIREYRQEIIKATVIALGAAIVFGIVHFFLGGGYEWHEVHLEEPTLTLRILSGLVFDSLGFILYELKFYLVLYIVMVQIFRMRRADYNAMKKVVWYLLMFIMGFYIVPWFMNVLNFVLTILLNVTMIVVYIAPAVGIFAIVFFPTVYFLKKPTKEIEQPIEPSELLDIR